MGSDDDGQLHQPGGWLLAFHPELVRNTPLAQFIKNYSFFSYSANEALHLSEQERRTIIDCMCKIREELLHPIDKHTKSLITDNIKLLLDYCERFYDRQFETRENVNLDILARFEQTLDDYLASNLPISKGTPTVQYCADKLCLSANYLSDLLKKGNRCFCVETYPAEDARYSERACIRCHQIHQRDILRIGISISATFQPLVQENGWGYT